MKRSAKGNGSAPSRFPSRPPAPTSPACRRARCATATTGVLTGTKRWAGYALAADFIEVLARMREPRPAKPRSAGLEPFLVVKEPGTFPDGMSGHTIDKIGYHGFLTWDLELTAFACRRATG